MTRLKLPMFQVPPHIRISFTFDYPMDSTFTLKSWGKELWFFFWGPDQIENTFRDYPIFKGTTPKWWYWFGLQNFFRRIEDKYNTTLLFLIFSVVWSFKTSAITSIKIKTEDKKFLPIFPKTLLFFRYLVLFMIRVTCIVSYFSPFMGLLGTMNHYQARRIKRRDILSLLNSYFWKKLA